MSARRRFPWWLLLLAFVGVPLLEIYAIIQVGQVIGAWWTILLLVADSLFGSWLVKREGRRAWEALRVALAEHRMPHRELADGVLILIGGVMMLSPGFVLDLVGALCILPFTRPLGRRVLARVISRRLLPSYAARSESRSPLQDQARRRPGPDDGVVRGEVVDP